MQISLSKQGGITVMHIAGDVDASNYTDVINKAQEAYDDGARRLLLDLSRVAYVSSAGLMALHTVALIFTGQSVKSQDGGRPSFRALNPQQDANVREYVKLLDPQPAVEQVLDVVGLKQFFEIHTDLDAAVKSFQG
ncbi:MAG TPA: STAS domain-containing protein [Anaerolineales bacterium]|nr:STAS domain-containing protein [Anaerolineales bacterium]